MKMLNRTTLNELFPNFLNDGIFTFIDRVQNYITPWKNDIAIIPLNTAYHGNHGNKIVSSLVDKLLTDDVLTNESIQTIANSLVAIYGKQWEKLYETLKLQYNPIENYNMTETSKDTDINTGTVSTNNSLVHGEKISNSGTSNIEATGDIYGFNSSSATPSDRSTQDNVAENTEIHTGTDTNDNTRTDDLQHENNHTLSRSGNIGVTTSQQMLESERNLWLWNYFDVVFSNIDSFLTCNTYN